MEFDALNGIRESFYGSQSYVIGGCSIKKCDENS